MFERDDPGSSLFAIASRLGRGRDQPGRSVDHRPDRRRLDLRRGRPDLRPAAAAPRSAPPRIRSWSRCRAIAALKLMAAVPAAQRAVTRISTERQLLQMFGSGLTPEDLVEVLETRRDQERQGGRGDHRPKARRATTSTSSARARWWSRRTIGGKPVFLSYLPAGSYVGEMALIDGGRRTATVRAAIKSEVIRLDGDAFRRLLDRKPDLLAKAQAGHGRAPGSSTSFVEAKKDGFGGVVDMYSSVASFLVENGIGEATDVLLIDENLCVGCDNCEKRLRRQPRGPARGSTARPARPSPISTCRPRAAIASIRTAWPIARPTPSTAAPTARSSSTRPASAAAIASATAPTA